MPPRSAFCSGLVGVAFCNSGSDEQLDSAGMKAASFVVDERHCLAGIRQVCLAGTDEIKPREETQQPDGCGAALLWLSHVKQRRSQGARRFDCLGQAVETFETEFLRLFAGLLFREGLPPGERRREVDWVRAFVAKEPEQAGQAAQCEGREPRRIGWRRKQSDGICVSHQRGAPALRAQREHSRHAGAPVVTPRRPRRAPRHASPGAERQHTSPR